MASGDIITRLVLDHSKHDQGLQQSKRALENYASSAGSVDGVVKNLITTFGKYASVTAAVTGALKVAKDAFFANEATIDEWGRTCESAKSLYDGFLTALNNGDISGYLTRIDSIVQAARTAYDELDRLATQKAINNGAVQKQNSENERMRSMLRTGRYIAPSDGRSTGGMKTGDLLTDAQKKNIAAHLEKGIQTTTNFIVKDIAQTDKSIESMYTLGAKTNGLSLKEFKKGTSNMDEFDKRLIGYQNYKDYEANRKTTTMTTSFGGTYNMTDNSKNPYEEFKKWGTFMDDGKIFEKINELINQRASLESQRLGNITQSYRTINRVEGVSTGISSGGKGGKGGTTEDPWSAISMGDMEGISSFGRSIENVKADLAAAQEQFDTAGDSLGRSMAQSLISKFKEELENMSTEDITKPFKDANSAIIETVDFGNGKGALPTMGKQATNTSKKLQGVASAFSAIGDAMNSIDDPSAKVAGYIASAIGSVVAGYGTATMQAADLGPWAWIAFAATGLATMITTIASIKSATSGSYADGGVIGGNSYVGDKLYARVNSGETILNASQAQTALDMMDASPVTAGGSSRSYVSGENIFLGLNNWGKRTGRGELVFSRS